MNRIIGLCVLSCLGAGILMTGCGSDDSGATNPTGTGGANAGSAGKAGSGGKAGSTGKAGSDGKAGAGGEAGGENPLGGAAGASAGSAGEGGAAEGGEAGRAGGVTFPEAPLLGAQIDRMGRPGVNTALTDPFDIVSGMTKDQVKDAYNLEADPAQWNTKFKGYIRTNLAILDSLDTTAATDHCGNQLLYTSSATGPARYDALAGVLVDDRLYVNTAVPVSGTLTCGQYLGVEANAVGIVNADCGGRTPKYDVIDTTYSVLAAGVLSGVGDSIPSDGKTTTTFPFLAPPQ